MAKSRRLEIRQNSKLTTLAKHESKNSKPRVFMMFEDFRRTRQQKYPLRPFLRKRACRFKSVTSTARSVAAGTTESVPPQSLPCWPLAQPPAHGRGWPQVAPPGSTAHAVGCEC